MIMMQLHGSKNQLQCATITNLQYTDDLIIFSHASPTGPDQDLTIFSLVWPTAQ